MPSGKTHDLITLLLAPPTAVAAWAWSSDLIVTSIVTSTMLFGGLMFGPDLDLHSVQYSRWGLLRVIWLPYRMMFRHRSRFTHGLLLGTVIRVIYFLAAVILLTAAVAYLHNLYLLKQRPSSTQHLWQAAHNVWTLLVSLDHRYLIAAFAGAWWGAASHTLADLIFTITKQTRKIF